MIARVLVAVVFARPTNLAHGQQDFERTVTVDKTANTDFDNIQDAIDSIESEGERYTVLIYSGTYDENVTLDGDDENIDLVGIDRDAVIIKPASGNGIVITSGTETERNNRITNLTIETASGHGIEIIAGQSPATDPIGIEFVDVTIRADGTGATGITGVDAEKVNVTECDITSDDGDGIVVGNHWTISSTSITTTEDSTSDQNAISLTNRSFLSVFDSEVYGEKRAIFLNGGTVEGSKTTDCLIQNSRLRTNGAGGAGHATVSFVSTCERILFQNCLIVSDATLTSNSRLTPTGIFSDGAATLDDIVFQTCRVVTKGDNDSGSTRVTAVQHDILGEITLIDCSLEAENKKTTSPASARGIANGDIHMFGGVIRTSSHFEKEVNVWDIEAVGTPLPSVSGTQFSKWKEPIKSSERPRSVVQRVLNVSVSSQTAILAATSLTTSEQTITGTSITNPDVYRVLTARGNQTGMNQDVFIIGTNWADEAITEKITLAGTSGVDGVRPFKTVTKIILPIQNGSSETVSIGTTNKLGLLGPISAASDVLQQANKIAAANSYSVVATGTVDVNYATVDLGILAAGGTSFEFVYLTPQ